MDRHYTPVSLAEKAVCALEEFEPALAVDFAAGEGALLKAVHDKWPACRLVANDIDKSALARLSEVLPSALRSSADFASDRSRAASPVLRAVRVEGASLIVLNPPFSNRGGSRRIVQFRDREFTCGAALAFVLYALRYLAPNGRMLALIPTSVLTSERDSDAIVAVRECYTVDEVLPRSKYAFRSCSVEVACVLLRPRAHVTPAPQARPASKTGSVASDVAVTRGGIAVHSPEPQVGVRVKFVHSTNLQNGSVTCTKTRVVPATALVSAPCVLIPRVGKPSPRKICVVHGSAPFAVSDCIFVLKVATTDQANRLAALLHSNWSELSSSYVGSCAKYLTLARLRALVAELSMAPVRLSLRNVDEPESAAMELGH